MLKIALNVKIKKLLQPFDHKMRPYIKKQLVFFTALFTFV